MNELLDKGFLPAVNIWHPNAYHNSSAHPSCLQPPAAYYQLYPVEPQVSSTNTSTSNVAPSSAQAKVDLITRYNLQDRLEQPVEATRAGNLEGKAAWLDTKEKREASLKERKAQMVLAARQ